MKALLMTLPHTNPVGPTLGIAVLCAHLKKKYPDADVKVMDLGLESFYWILSAKTVQKSIDKLSQTIKETENQSEISYSQQQLYVKSLIALETIKNYRNHIKSSIETLKDSETYRSDEKRNEANFIINILLKSIGLAWGNTTLNAADYRTAYSPFSAKDIADFINEEEKCIYNDFFDEWISEHPMDDVDYLGISISFAKQVLPSFLFSKKIKSRYPNILIQIGGSMMAHMNNEAFLPLMDYCDCIVQREGEYPLERIIRKLIQHEKIDRTDGVIYKERNGQLIFPEPMPKVNLDLQPTPDFSDFDMTAYITPSPNIPLQIGRSCYWGKCSFCCLNTAFAHKNCWTSVQKLVDDIEYIVNTEKVNTIEFVDDAIPPAFAELLSDEIIKRKLKIKWFGYARFDTKFNYELFKKMYSSGCVGIKFGLESASPNVLQAMNKGINPETAAELFKQASYSGIIPQAAFFLGFPGETLEDMRKTQMFLKNNVIPYGIIAYNGQFRLLKSMPLLAETEKYGIKKVEKWNSKEDLIDYYIVEMNSDFNVAKAIADIESILSKEEFKDLTRSVDLRRYWFAGYGENEMSEDFCCCLTIDSPFQINLITLTQDKRTNLFMPGEGIYKTKSYISDGMHENTVLEILDFYKPYLDKGNIRSYTYDLKNQCFTG